MARYSTESEQKLETCHEDLQVLFKKVVRKFDNTVLYGHRSPEFQNELYKKGRKFVQGKWVVDDKSKVVTNCDGYEEKSDHNLFPSKAVDVAPYPIDLVSKEGLERIRFFAGYVLGTAQVLRDQGVITSEIRWGGDWDNDTELKDQTFNDLLHFYVVD